MRKLLYALAAPVIAAAAALGVSAIVLWLSGEKPLDVFEQMWTHIDSTDRIVSIINVAVPYYIAGIAVAIGFTMNLFNIGVVGQYRLAALVAGVYAGAISAPAVLHVGSTMVVAALVGMAWAAIPAVLKVTRGVNEVVATIMLNFIAVGLSAYLLLTYFRDEEALIRTQIAQTVTLEPSGRFPNLDSLLPFDLSPRNHLQGYLLVAIVLGVAMHVMLTRSRFGLKLRTSGANAATARSSGVNPSRMIVSTFLISGGLAGLAAMGPLLGERLNYSDTFPTGVGFIGISVALLGQNNPGGIAVAAFIWSAVEDAARGIDNGPPEITQIMLGALLLSAVIAFTAMKRRATLAAIRDAAQASHTSRGNTCRRAAGRTDGDGMTTPVIVPDARVSRLAAQGLDTPFKRTIAISLAGFLVLSLVRVLADVDQMTTGFTFGLGLAATAPILCAGLGGLVCERTGTVNIGLEGMMILGTWFAGWAGWQWGIWWAIPAGIFGGMLGGVLHGIATIQFGVNHIVSGIAINLIAPGVARFLSSQFFVGQDDGAIASSPTMHGTMGSFTAPFISGGPFLWLDKTWDPLGWIDRQRWFFLSDVAGFGKGMTTRVAYTTILVFLALVGLWYLLWRMPLGLRMRSAGEKPDATDSLGVSVYKMRYIGCAMSGALAGLGGAWLAIDVRAYQEGQVGGRGFLGLAALVFGNWLPLGVLAGAGLFGYVQALSSLPTTSSVRALFLLGAIATIGFAIIRFVRKKPVSGAALSVTGIALLTFYLNTERVNNQLVYVMPYLVTLVVISVASQNLRPPAADGIPWHKGGS